MNQSLIAFLRHETGTRTDVHGLVATKPETLTKAADEIEELRGALVSMRDLAAVAHEGDPWYAENAGIAADVVFLRARRALGEAE